MEQMQSKQPENKNMPMNLNKNIQPPKNHYMDFMEIMDDLSIFSFLFMGLVDEVKNATVNGCN